MQRLQQKLAPWIALGVTSFSLFTSNYLNSLMVVPARVNSVSEINNSVSNLSDSVSEINNSVSNISNSISNIGDTESTPQSLNSLEQSVYEQINKHRESKGLPPLVLDAWLTQQAREHSQAIAKGDISFDREVLGQLNQKIIQTGPYQSAGAAIGMTLGYANPAQANVDNWLKDVYGDNPATIDGKYELTGVGVAMNVKGQYYFTQIFLLR